MPKEHIRDELIIDISYTNIVCLTMYIQSDPNIIRHLMKIKENNKRNGNENVPTTTSIKYLHI